MGLSRHDQESKVTRDPSTQLCPGAQLRARKLRGPGNRGIFDFIVGVLHWTRLTHVSSISPNRTLLWRSPFLQDPGPFCRTEICSIESEENALPQSQPRIVSLPEEPSTN